MAVINKISNVYNSVYSSVFMATIAGFSDVFTFISLNHMFSAHVTGNVIIAISLLVHGVGGGFGSLKVLLSVIPVYIIVCIIMSLFFDIHGLSKKCLSIWMLIECFLYLILMIIGLTFLSKIDIYSWTYVVICMIPIVAMSIHNLAMVSFFCKLPPTTVITGDVARVLFGFTNIFFIKSFVQGNDALKEKTKHLFFLVLGFVVGALVAAFGCYYLGFYAIIYVICIYIFFILFCLNSLSD